MRRVTSDSFDVGASYNEVISALKETNTRYSSEESEISFSFLRGDWYCTYYFDEAKKLERKEVCGIS